MLEMSSLNEQDRILVTKEILTNTTETESYRDSCHDHNNLTEICVSEEAQITPLSKSALEQSVSFESTQEFEFSSYEDKSDEKTDNFTRNFRPLSKLIQDEFFGNPCDFTEQITRDPETFADIINQLDDPELNYGVGICDEVRDHSFDDNHIYNLNESFRKNRERSLDLHPRVSAEGFQSEAALSQSENESSINDPLYHPDIDDHDNTAEDDSEAENVHQNTTTDQSDLSVDTSLSAKIPHVTGSLNKDDLTVKAKTTKTKENCCLYCNTWQTVISRHLAKKHKDKSPVKRFLMLPPKNPERVKMIETLRLRGNYENSRNPNTNHKLQVVVARRPKEDRPASMYQTCHACKGTFSVKSIRRHRQRCVGTSNKNKRSNSILSRRIEGEIHKDASEQLTRVFSVLRNDDIVKLIKYDKLIINFANILCEKYRKQQYHDMIRNRLRTLGRLLKTMKELDSSITDFQSIFHPKLHKTMIQAVNVLAGFDPDTGEHRTPCLVSSIGTYVKAVGETLKIDCIERVDDDQEKLVERYLFLHRTQYNVKVNRVALETHAKKQRQQKKPLPTTDDIRKLSEYVVQCRQKAYENLTTQYSYETWLDLAKYTLISIQTFNRRRAGEIERTLINDLKNIERVDEKSNPEVYKTLSAEQKQIVTDYVRFEITGKLGRSVPVILDSRMEACLSLVMKFRQAAKIPSRNPFLFGVPGFEEGRFKYLRACVLMRQFANECGAEHPERLRGTFLRKHMATACAVQNMDENEIVDIANFMGHAEAIHRSHYRRTTVARDLIGPAKLLRSVMGNDADIIPNSSDENVVEQSCEIPRSEEDIARRVHANSLPENEEVNQAHDGNEDKGISEEEPSTSNPQVPTKRKIRKRKHISSSESEASATNSEESSDESDEDNLLQKKKCGRPKKQSSTVGMQKQVAKKCKKRWTDEEKAAAFSAFGHLVQDNRLPSTKQIQAFLKKYPAVKRTVDQIRTWASNEKKKYNLSLCT